MNKYCTIFILLLTLLCGDVISAVEPAYKVHDFKEEYNPDVNVSGRLLVGIQVPTKNIKSIGRKLFVQKPANLNAVDVLITTIDGVYSAKFQVEYLSPEGGWQEIELPSKELKELSKFKQNEIVAYAYSKVGGDKSTVHRLYLTSWGMPSNEQPTLFVNSSAAITYYRLKGGKEPCTEITAINKTAFSHSCPWSESFRKGDNLLIINASSGLKKKYEVWVN